jgi:hypothetical protein
MIDYETETKILRLFNPNPGFSVSIAVLNSMEDIPAFREAVQKLIDENTGEPIIHSTLTFFDVWPQPEEQARRMKIIDEIREIMNDDALKLLKGEDRKEADNIRSYLDVEPIPMDANDQDLINFFSPREGNIGTYAYIQAHPRLSMSYGKDAMLFANTVRRIETERGPFLTSSQTVVFADVLGLMIHDARETIWISVLLIFVLVWLDFGSFQKTLLVLSPLLSGIMLMFVLLYSYGSRLNFYNIVVIPLIVGLGVDDGIHLYHRYLQDGRGSILNTLQTTGKSVWVTSVTTFIGFFGLALSHHNGLQSMGFLAMAGIFGCLVTSLSVLPALVQFFENRKKIGTTPEENGKKVQAQGLANPAANPCGTIP